MTDMTRARAFPGRHFPAMGRTLSSFGSTPPLNKLVAFPFDVHSSFDAISMYIKTAGSTNSVVRAGIHGVLASGLPGALVYDTGEYSTATSGPLIMPLDTTRLLDSIYWITVLFGGDTAPSMLSSNSPAAIEMQRIFGVSDNNIEFGIANNVNAVVADYTYGPLPEEFPEPVLSGSSLWVAVRSV